MTARPWTVNKPGPLVKRAEGVWTVDDLLPGSRPVPRKMTVVQHDDGLLFFNAVPVTDAVLDELRALGKPKYLIVPNAFHSLDAVPFAEKLGLQSFASAPTIADLKERVPALQPIERLPAGAAKVFTVKGFRTQEVALVAHGSLIVADLFTNLPHQKGLSGLVMRLIGFTGPAPILPKPVRKRVQVSAADVRSLLNELAALPDIKRLIPSHGEVLEGGSASALQAIAHSL